jgi:hypothetical protein
VMGAELMVQFTLPKNSKITAGKTSPRSAGARNPREFRVYRWNPDDANNPRMDRLVKLPPAGIEKGDPPWGTRSGRTDPLDPPPSAQTRHAPSRCEPRSRATAHHAAR